MSSYCGVYMAFVEYGEGPSRVTAIRSQAGAICLSGASRELAQESAVKAAAPAQSEDPMSHECVFGAGLAVVGEEENLLGGHSSSWRIEEYNYQLSIDGSLPACGESSLGNGWSDLTD